MDVTRILVASLLIQVCMGNGNLQTTPKGRKCSFSEFVLLLDESSSIMPKNWIEVKNFAKKLISVAGVSEYGNHAGVASFANYGRNRITCDKHSKTDSYLKNIDTLTQQGEWTNMEDGLEKGEYLLSHSGCGQRKNEFSKIIFLLTDGIPNKGGSIKTLFKKAHEIREKGIKIVAVGVGDFIDFGVLSNITSDKKSVYQVHKFDELTQDSLIEKLINPICVDSLNPSTVKKEKPTTTTTTTTNAKTTKRPTTTTKITTRLTTTTTTTTTITKKPTTTTKKTTTTTKKPTTTTNKPTTTTNKPTTTTNIPTTTTKKPTTTTKKPTTTTKKPTTTTKKPTTTTKKPTTTTKNPTTTTKNPTTTTTTKAIKIHHKPLHQTTKKIEEFNDKERFSSALCSCTLEEKQFPLLKLSVYDVDKYPGSCRREKVEAALADIKKTIQKLHDKQDNFKVCRKDLRRSAYQEVKYTLREEVYFYKVDECTVNIECKLPAWVNVLEKKKCELEDELRWYQGTYGKIWDYGENAYNQVAGIWK